ncbi:caspase family protein [Microvirga massiliensis]|uniref:caspase family protein n=1 Tax=Microvirga massiliensis TaxID=1033741 RepID=UPI00069B2B83
MRGPWVRLLAFVWIVFAGSIAVAEAQEVRIALVIGNSGYAAVGHLPNAERDAATIAQTLRDVGFKTVRVASDLNSSEMRRIFRDFGAEAEKADWAVVYYAGHGIEVGGTNYLIPVDARLKSDRDVVFEALPLDQVITSIEGARKLRLIILDACRDNPFLNQMTRSVATRSIGRGLARIEPEGGTLVAYAAKAGQVAFDGGGENSPFVAALARRIKEPGLEISMVFRAVRDDVLAATNKRQEPFVYGSLPNEAFYFRPISPSDAQAKLPSDPASSASLPSVSPPAANPQVSPRPKPPRVPSTTKIVPEERQRASNQRPSPPRAGISTPPKNCFTFNGRSYCE